MEKPALSLRQRKLLYVLLHNKGLVTGAKLAGELGTTSRTVRNDVAAINALLGQEGVEIVSVRGKGYSLQAESPEKVRPYLQREASFEVRQDRLRYLSFQLAFADGAISLNDLEEEMFVSRTTLENDLRFLKETFTKGPPYISVLLKHGSVSLEQDERKRRMLLNALYAQDWNYHSHDNAFYDFDYLDERLLERITELLGSKVLQRGIQLEDANAVELNLACTIMVQQLKRGRRLPDAPAECRQDSTASEAAENLADEIEELTECTIPDVERDELYRMLVWGRRIDASALSFQSASQYFDREILDMAEDFLNRVARRCNMDFWQDEDFYITLLQLIRYFQSPFAQFPTDRELRSASLPELEIARLFQETSHRYHKPPLNETELLYLANCLSGAVEFLFHFQPERKIRTVICCHMYVSVAWTIKRKVLARFRRWLLITDLIPVSTKDTFDFQNTDLILSTVQKTISGLKHTHTLVISPQVTPEDIKNIENYIQSILSDIIQAEKR